MKRISTAIALLVLVAAMPAYGSVWKKSLTEAQAEARKKDQLMLVEMYASWCGWCRKMAQEVFPSESFQNATADLVLLQLDTEDGKEGTKISRELQIRSLPTLVLLTPELMIAGVITGYAPAKQFTEQLEATLKTWEQFADRIELDAKKKLSPAESLDLAKELAARRGFDQAKSILTRLSSQSSLPRSIRAEAYYELARVRAYLNDHDDALVAVRDLEKLDPEGEISERAKVLLAEIYFLQKDYVRSLAELRKFKSNHPDSPLIENVDRLLPQVESAASRNQ